MLRRFTNQHLFPNCGLNDLNEKHDKLLDIKTLGELKKTDYKSRSVKDELRAKPDRSAFPKTAKAVLKASLVLRIPLSPIYKRLFFRRHNILLLGLRGQAKTRIARLLVNLLDEYIPYIEGSELFDDPYETDIMVRAPANRLEKGDATQLPGYTALNVIPKNWLRPMLPLPI